MIACVARRHGGNCCDFLIEASLYEFCKFLLQMYRIAIINLVLCRDCTLVSTMSFLMKYGSTTLQDLT